MFPPNIAAAFYGVCLVGALATIIYLNYKEHKNKTINRDKETKQ